VLCLARQGVSPIEVSLHRTTAERLSPSWSFLRGKTISAWPPCSSGFTTALIWSIPCLCSVRAPD